MNYGITVSKMIWVVKTHFYMLIFEYDIHRMAIIHFSLEEGEPTITFLGDLDRICHIIDKHARENLANIKKLDVFYRNKTGVIVFECYTHADEYAYIPPVVFNVLGERCRVIFDKMEIV
jgi:hypothetical protein